MSSRQGRCGRFLEIWEGDGDAYISCGTWEHTLYMHMHADEEGCLCLWSLADVLCISVQYVRCTNCTKYKIRVANRHNGGQACTILYYTVLYCTVLYCTEYSKCLRSASRASLARVPGQSRCTVLCVLLCLLVQQSNGGIPQQLLMSLPYFKHFKHFLLYSTCCTLL